MAKSYKITRTLILGPVKTINRNKTVDGVKQKVGEEMLNDIVGYEITRDDGKKLALPKDQACQFVAKQGGVIENAMLGERTVGGKPSFYLRGINGLSLKDPKLTLRIDDGKETTGNLKPAFAAFKGIKSMTERASSKPRRNASDVAKKAMAAFQEKGVKFDTDF